MKFEKLNPKKVEKDLAVFLSKIKIKGVSVEWLKDFIFNFDKPTSSISKDYFQFMMNKLPAEINEKDFEKAMMLFNDAWNAFPQKILKGASPQDKFFEGVKDGELEENVDESKLTEQEKMFKQHFEYAEKNLDGYMKWAFDEVMPKYDKYVKNLKLDKRTTLDSVGVAGVFLEICGQMGMFEFDKLHPGFIEDFPKLFEKSVVGPKISREQIKSHITSFISFLEIFYNINFLHRSSLMF